MYYDEFLNSLSPIQLFYLAALAFILSSSLVAVIERFCQRKIDNRLKVLERIVLDESKVVINIDDFEAYCSSKFSRPDNLEGYFKFNPDGTVSKVSDLDIDCSAVDIDKPTE